MWIGRVQSVVVQKQTSRHRFLEPYLDPLDITDPLVRKQAYFVGCFWFSPKASSGRQQRLLYNSVTDHQLYPIQSTMGFVEPKPAGDVESRLYTMPMQVYQRLEAQARQTVVCPRPAAKKARKRGPAPAIQAAPFVRQRVRRSGGCTGLRSRLHMHQAGLEAAGVRLEGRTGSNSDE